MILLCGIPSETTLASVASVLLEHNAPHIIVNQRNTASPRCAGQPQLPQPHQLREDEQRSTCCLMTRRTRNRVNFITVLLRQVNLLPTDDPLVAAAATTETVAVFATTRATEGGLGMGEGPVQVYEHARTEGTARAPCVFTATLYRRPPGPGVLRVQGACTFSTTGHGVQLTRHEPPGINPSDLLLDFVVKPPSPDDFVGFAFTTYHVSYEEQTEASVDTVTILPDGPSIKMRMVP